MCSTTGFHRLPQSEFSSVTDMFAVFKGHLCVQSVLVGNTPGRIYIHTNHHSAILWNRMDAIYVVNHPEAEVSSSLATLIGKEIAPDAARRFIPVLNITTQRQSTIDQIRDLFRAFNPTCTPRYAFAYQGAIQNRCLLTEPWDIRPIDRLVLSLIDHENFEAMLGWIQSFWHSTDDFLAQGIGFCALQANTIASWCLSVYAAVQEYELGVATAPEYRSLGLATAVSAECVQACALKGYEPQWHCDQHNTPSVRLAEKLGFRIRERYQNLTLDIEALIPEEVR